MNNADLIVATLKAAGIDRGFGIPSGNVLPLMEAMRKGGIDFVLTAHEGSAGFAAAMKALLKLTQAPDAAIAKAGELIAKAKRPIAVLGSSAMRIAKPELLRQVIERHNLPFATTTMAKGMIDEDHPLSVGVIERSFRQIQRKLLRSADLIVGLGYDTVEVEYEAWIGDVPLLQVDIEKVDAAPSVNVVHEVTGDLDGSLTRLAALPASKNSWTPEALAGHRRAFHAALRPPTNT